jgi:hypothetical protein
MGQCHYSVRGQLRTIETFRAVEILKSPVYEKREGL